MPNNNGTGQTYGAFSGRSGTRGANRVMQVAKALGQEKRAKEEWENYRTLYDAWIGDEESKREWGKNIGMMAQLAMSAIPGFGFGKGVGTIADKLLPKFGNIGLGRLIGAGGEMLADAIIKPGDKPEYKPTISPYAAKFTKPWKEHVGEEERDYEDHLKKTEQERWLMHALAQFSSEGESFYDILGSLKGG